MKKLAYFALAIVAFGCSAEPEGAVQVALPGVADPGASPAQVRAFEALQRDTSLAWSWVQHETLRTPMHLSAARTGAPMLRAGVSAEQATLELVGRYKDLFKMRDARAELRLARSEVDELAMTHVRFQQVHHGIPVVGAELAAHYDRAGHITSLDANYVSGLDAVELAPALAPSVGLELARADVLARTPGVDASLLETSEGKLVVFALGQGPATLAFEYTIRAVFGDEPAVWVITVDARTGKVVDRYNNLQTIEATGTGVLGDVKKFEVTQSGATYSMADASRGVNIRTFSAAGQEIGPAQGATVVTSTSLTTWDTGTGAGAAVDAHTHAGVVFDYYKNVHARNAIDGAGGPMLSTAHFGTAYDNAFWDGTGMSYGDGGTFFRPLSAGLDVVAHEFTHGVTEKTSNLRYQSQSGALNESVSDIFAAFIEHSLKPDEVKNWTIGESIVKQAGLLRDFKDPAAARQPAHMTKYVNTQQDQGGVHINSGIINNAAYLMTVGGENPVSKTIVAAGVGWAKSEKLWYRANTKYFLTTTNFAQAAVGVMQAAKDLALTEAEQNVVDCAWKATGVVQGTCAPVTEPKSVPVPAAPGSTADPSGSAPGEIPGATGAAEGEETEPGSPTTKAPTTRPRSTLVSETSSTCAVGARGPGERDRALGPMAGLLVAAAFALSRRRRR